MTAAIVVLLVCLALLGLPLFVVLAAGGLLAAVNSDLDPAVLIIEMVRIGSSPNLIAIPFFTLAGIVLATGGAPSRLIKLFSAAFGWMPGGLAVVALVSCAFFTAFSGASGVTILALGGLLYPMLRNEGYAKRFSLGLLTSSGSLGLLFPPSLAILVYAVVAQVSIEQLFLAGLIPGLLLLIMLGLYSVYTGYRFNSRHIFTWRNLRTAVHEGIWDLLLPLGVISGLLGGYLTVTEISACTAIYAFFLESIIHKTIAFRRQFLDISKETAIMVGTILVILGVAMGLTNLLVDAQVPNRLFSVLERYITSQIGFLLLLNIFLLIVGCMMDIFSAIVVVVPLILPLAHRFGVDPLHLGIIFLANLEIGYTTPPVGINLFLASQRFKESVMDLFYAAVPFLILMLIWLIIITYIPATTLWWRRFPSLSGL